MTKKVVDGAYVLIGQKARRAPDAENVGTMGRHGQLPRFDRHRPCRGKRALAGLENGRRLRVMATERLSRDERASWKGILTAARKAVKRLEGAVLPKAA